MILTFKRGISIEKKITVGDIVLYSFFTHPARSFCMEAEEWSLVHSVPVQGLGQPVFGKNVLESCSDSGQRLCGQELSVRESKSTIHAC